MVITLGNIVFGGKGNGGSSTASAYVVPDGMRFRSSTFTTFPVEGLDFSQKTNFESCWLGCYSLKSFPVVNFSNGETFENAWDSCSSLTTFPKIEFPKATNFMYAWQNCTGMTTFEGIVAPNATSFYMAWAFCSSLVDFPETIFGTCSLNSALGGCVCDWIRAKFGFVCFR